jgi:carbon monoxide dehydrogenase subunit G
MLIENDFEVPAPLETVWAYLLDVERVAPCMPGAQLTGAVDDRTWKGKVFVKLGPVSLSFAGTVTMEERDDEAHKVVLKASGMEQRGKGAATAVVTAWAESADSATRVRFSQDLTISGAVAQYSRGMMQDVTTRLTREFAQCLEASLRLDRASTDEPTAAGAQPVAAEVGSAEAAPPVPRPAPPTAGAVEGFRLTGWALWRAALRTIERLLERLLEAVRSLQR